MRCRRLARAHNSINSVYKAKTQPSHVPLQYPTVRPNPKRRLNSTYRARSRFFHVKIIYQHPADLRANCHRNRNRNRHRHEHGNGHRYRNRNQSPTVWRTKARAIIPLRLRRVPVHHFRRAPESKRAVRVEQHTMAAAAAAVSRYPHERSRDLVNS